MNDILEALLTALRQGQSVVMCAIVDSSGSAPRTSGARMLVFPDGTILGSVGGGPVEAACQRHAAKLPLDNGAYDTMSFDLSSSTAAEAGMVCGGAARVLLQRITPEHIDFFARLDELVRNRQRPTLATILTEAAAPLLALWSQGDGWQGPAIPTPMAEELARKAAKSRQPFRLESEGLRIFAEPVVSPGVVHLVGAGHVAKAVATVADFAGFEVVVMDDRADFANAERYPRARDVRVLSNFDGCLADLGEDDYVIIVTRGHVHDRDVLAQALRTNAGYIGMIGSKSKRAAVYRSLLESGYTQADLDRVFCPIGLPIGADTPHEIAISIVGELIQARAGAAR